MSSRPTVNKSRGISPTRRGESFVTPLDPDYLHPGQVWRDESGQDSVVLHVHCSASVRLGLGLAKISVGGAESFVGSNYFAGRRLVKCVVVDWVEEVVEGEVRIRPVPDYSREWRVSGGVGQLLRVEGERKR